jgi:hypothetical protein
MHMEEMVRKDLCMMQLWHMGTTARKLSARLPRRKGQLHLRPQMPTPHQLIFLCVDACRWYSHCAARLQTRL